LPSNIFDKVDARLLGLDTAVLATTAYLFANADERVGRRLSHGEVLDLVDKTGRSEAVEMEYGTRWR
jgi:hypothetical protein